MSAKNSVLDRTSRPPMTRVSRLLAWVLAGLLAAAAVLGAGYWGYRQMQPTPLFTSDSTSPHAARTQIVRIRFNPVASRGASI
jgi:hypothetical protein